MSSDSRCRPLSESLREYGRGIVGGLLFSLPLLYTMEVWWQGFIAHPARLLIYVLVTFLLLLGYNRFAGLREDASFGEVVMDSVEELGLGLVLATFILWLLGRITPEMPASEVMGKIIIEAMTVAIGVSIGTAQLGVDNGGDEAESDESEKQNQEPNFWEQIVIAFCGAVLIAANVGPTEEIVMLAVELPPIKILAMALFSFILGATILHFAGFRGAERLVHRQSTLEIMRGSVVTYAVALLSSAFICWFFGRFDGASFEIALSQTVVLAFPAILGASAGRLLLQTNQQESN